MDDDKIFDEEGERPRIKVTDRRKFSADGTPLEQPETGEARDAVGAPPTDDAEPAAASETRPAATDEPQETTADDGEEPGADMPVADEAPAAAPDDDGEPRIAGPAPSMADLPRDFSAFVESLYYEAMLFMGAIPDPRTGQTHEDVELAKYKIDILAMLQEKTDGNRTAEETQHLEEILYQLRMVYLQKSKAINL